MLPVGTYTFTIRATSENGDFVEATFTWVLTSPCEAPSVTITSTTQDNYVDTYTDTAQSVTLTPFTTEPVGCAAELTYECTSVVGPDSSDFTSVLCSSGSGRRRMLQSSAAEFSLSLQAAYS